MASIPTSRSVSRLSLRLIEPDGGVAAESSLLPVAAAPDGVEICEAGYVMEAGTYRFCLVSDEPLGVVDAEAEIEGTRVGLTLLGAPLTVPAGSPLAGCSLQMMEPAGGEQGGPFGMVYALVRIQLSLGLGDGSALELTTLDVPCVARGGDSNRGRETDAMIKDLAMGDDEALTWMFSVADGFVSAQTWGMPEKGMGGAGATEARLGAVTAALDEFDACLPAMRVQSARRVRQVERLVPVREARRCGRAEAAWLARHPETLVPRASGPVRLADGRRFAPAQLAVAVSQRSSDTSENVAVLGFLSGLADDLTRLARNLEARAERAERAVARLRRIDAPEAALPALTVTSLGARRLRGLANRAAALRVRSTRVRRSYADCMPEAAAACADGTVRGVPRKTKVFCEVELYARLWHAMEQAGRAHLDAIGREGVALQMLRLSDLYELYVLHRMLAWLQRAGFGPSTRAAHPFEVGRYTVDDARYRPHEGVAGVYRLERGMQRITLYYQPVLHGTEREEMGIALHRTTVARWSHDGRPKGDYPYFTPDFLMEVEGPGGRSVYVLDAKYAARKSLLTTEMRYGGEKVDRGVSMFQTVALKYLLETVDARTGRPADAAWLLCGDVNCGLWRYQTSPWAQARRDFRFSGVAGVAAGADCLDGLFAEMGIEAPAGIRPMAASTVSAPAHWAQPVVTAVAEPVASEPVAVEPMAEQLASEASGTTVQRLAAQPAREFALQPASSPAPAPVPEPVSEPVLEPVAEPVPEPAKPAEPAARPDQHGRQRSARSSRCKPKTSSKSQQAEHPDIASAKGASKSGCVLDATRSFKPVVEAGDITRMLEAVPDPAWLYDVRYVRRMCGVNHPLVRDKNPTGAEAKAYAPVQFNGKAAYVRVKFTPVELNRLRRALARFGMEAEDVTATPSTISGENLESAVDSKQHAASHAARSAGCKKADAAAQAIELVSRLWPNLVDPSCVRDPRFCQRTFGINVPVVRDKLGPRDAPSYRETVLGGERAFVFSKANPVQLTRLRKYTERIVGAEGIGEDAE